MEVTQITTSLLGKFLTWIPSMFGLTDKIKDKWLPFKDEDVLLYNEKIIIIEDNDTLNTNRNINISYRIDNKTYDKFEIYGIKVKIKFDNSPNVSIFEKIELLKFELKENKEINFESQLNYFESKKIDYCSSIDLEMSFYIEYWGRKTIVTHIRPGLKFEKKLLNDQYTL